MVTDFALFLRNRSLNNARRYYGLKKNRKIGKGNLYLIKSPSGRNERRLSYVMHKGGFQVRTLIDNNNNDNDNNNDNNNNNT